MLTDIRYALRSLWTAPGFTIAAVLTLALGIGLNTAIFSIVNAVLIRKLPYKDPGRIVALYETETELPKAPVTAYDLARWRERCHTLEAVSSFKFQFATLSGRELPERVVLNTITPDFFQTLGVSPVLGRAFSAEEGTEGHDRVVILTDSLFQRRFGGNRSVLGRSILLDGAPHIVVGIMPPAFRPFNRFSFVVEAFTPMVLTPPLEGGHDRFAIGRLKPGITLPQAQAEMSVIAAQLERERPQWNGSIGARVVSLDEDITGNVHQILLVLLGSVGIILLIACANVANLLLARGTARRSELAIRAALGAGRWRIARQLLTESLVLASIGGVLGLALAYGGVAGLKQIEALNLARLEEVSVDRLVLVYSILITAAAGLVFGFVPALLQSRSSPGAELKQAGDRTVAGGGRAAFARSVLVASEIGLAVVLLIGAGLMIRSLARLLASPLGFQPEGVLTAQIWLPQSQYGSDEKTAAFSRNLLEHVRAIPGVVAASTASKLPLRGGNNGTMIVEGETYSGAQMEGPLVEDSSVYPGFFKAMGIPLRAGRVFEETDLRKGFEGLIVNESFVRVLLHGHDAIGKRISYSKNPPHWQEIIGVVADTRQHGILNSAMPEAYELGSTPYVSLVVRTTLAPSSLAGPIRRELAAVDRDVPLAEVHTMQDILDISLAPSRIYMRLVGLFAAVALALASIGIYGLIAFAVSQREHEIGIRVALGATSRNVIAMVLAQAAKPVLAGLLSGATGALALTRYMKSLLYETSPVDAATFACVAGFLVVVALSAAFVPALRATAIHPAQALRHE